MANPHSQEHLLLEAMQRMAVDDWVRDVPFPELAEASGLGLRSVPRQIERLEKAGRIRCHNERGRGRINSYEILN